MSLTIPRICRSVLLLSVLLLGCSPGPKFAPVSGRVTVGGKAITTGVIMFHPADGPTAVGAIQPDGSYTLVTTAATKVEQGALVGQHRVTIQATSVGPGSLVEPKSFDDEVEMSRKPGKILVAGTVTWLVPEKYSQLTTTDLTADVKDTPNIIPFALP